MKKLIRAFFLLILTLIGLIFLVLFITRVPSLGVFGEARRTIGTVVGINTEMESGEIFQVPRVQFITEDNRQISINMICPPLDCFSDYSVGSQVPVVYPSSFPELAIADSTMGRLGTPLFILAFGLAFTLPGPIYLAILISERRKDFSSKPTN